MSKDRHRINLQVNCLKPDNTFSSEIWGSQLLGSPALLGFAFPFPSFGHQDPKTAGLSSILSPTCISGNFSLYLVPPVFANPSRALELSLKYANKILHIAAYPGWLLIVFLIQNNFYSMEMEMFRTYSRIPHFLLFAFTSVLNSTFYDPAPSIHVHTILISYG